MCGRVTGSVYTLFENPRVRENSKSVVSKGRGGIDFDSFQFLFGVLDLVHFYLSI